MPEIFLMAFMVGAEYKLTSKMLVSGFVNKQSIQKP